MKTERGHGYKGDKPWKSLLNSLAPQLTVNSPQLCLLPTYTPTLPLHYLFPQTLIFTTESSICGLSVQHLSCHTTQLPCSCPDTILIIQIPTVAQYNSSPFSAPTPGWLDTAREDMPKWGLRLHDLRGVHNAAILLSII